MIENSTSSTSKGCLAQKRRQRRHGCTGKEAPKSAGAAEGRAHPRARDSGRPSVSAPGGRGADFSVSPQRAPAARASEISLPRRIRCSHSRAVAGHHSKTARGRWISLSDVCPSDTAMRSYCATCMHAAGECSCMLGEVALGSLAR